MIPVIKLRDKLSIEQQKEILSHFGFFVDVENRGIIYDDEGEEFYGWSCNDSYDLSTLEGILNYAKHQSFQFGKSDVQNVIKVALGL